MYLLYYPKHYITINVKINGFIPQLKIMIIPSHYRASCHQQTLSTKVAAVVASPLVNCLYRVGTSDIGAQGCPPVGLARCRFQEADSGCCNGTVQNRWVRRGA